ncbi:DNA repair protein RecN [Gracilibacillus alcaliphilus]|uniref:DNA repair protein RecN n=1 Tax=Gracilibacillus alcaliphilus TaxID=1401441 RepID=UPI00195B0FFE|nr:DNA repair protein RecN [Gracilibacillus alcaliphilus]MBM7675074.1 DNA repair protein RecN (Recombination protein N) [Gracilibacillus alcaliphilus]
MLAELSIKNFAIIDQLSISFHKGLTVLTGETGAGKSIIIDALGLLVGGRGSVDYVRHGEKKAEIEGLFILEDTKHPVYNKTQELGFEIKDDQMLVLQRTISESGKSICRINGKLTTLAILKEIGQSILDIHSQHETQALLNQEKHIELLDQFLQSNHPAFKQEYQAYYTQYKELTSKLEATNKNERELAQRLDLLEFQLNEIQQAELEPDEDIMLTEERNHLHHFEQTHQALNTAYNSLHGEQKALDWLSMAANNLETAGEYNKDIQQMHQKYVDHYFMIEEISYSIRQFVDSMDYDPARLAEIEARLHEIDQLKRKYGPTVEEIMTYSATVEEELEEIRNRDQHLANLSETLRELTNDMLLEAKELHALRKKTASDLEQAVLAELQDLYLEKAVFTIDVSIPAKAGGIFFEGKDVQPHGHGLDQVNFLISTNPGEPVKELAKIASGGEMSRIMLALKNIFSKHQGITSVIFDEVDTGVSGRVAQAMAEKIYNISKGSQVLCITHLPQVASIADTHLKIEKVVDHNRTHTTIQELSFQERVDEIGKMITGNELTEASKTHAKELIEMNHQRH